MEGNTLVEVYEGRAILLLRFMKGANTLVEVYKGRAIL